MSVQQLALEAAPGVADKWCLDPEIAFLNHGSFGACPIEILDRQTELRRRLEREPVSFMARELEGLLDQARAEVAAFVGADTENFAFVQNATTGVNAVLRSLSLKAGEVLVTTDQGYNACANALRYVAERTGAKVRVIALPFPCPSKAALEAAVLEALDPTCRLLLIDHVASPTGFVFPLESLVPKVEAMGIPVLVDGAHAPGMLPLSLERLAASYYTGNLHKWCCAPKGAAFLWVRSDLRAQLRPVVISHGANAETLHRSRFHLEFDWVGTGDPTPFLCAAESIAWMERQHPEGWAGLRARNRALALAARALLCERLGVAPLCPESMVASLAAVLLPDEPPGHTQAAAHQSALQDRLLLTHRIEVPILPWPHPPKRLLRVSAQLYNGLPQYEALAEAIREAIDWESRRDASSR